MKRSRSPSLFLAVLLSGVAAGATSVTVKVADNKGAPLKGAQVCACHFGPKGPDAQTRLAVADASGVASFSLTDGVRYEILAVVQGDGPSLGTQYSNPNHPFVVPDGEPASANVVLVPVAGGALDAQLVGASPGGPVLVTVKGPRRAPADGLALANLSGFARVRVDNVPFAPAGTLTLTAYDPASGKTAATVLDQALTPARPFRTYSLNFNIVESKPAGSGWVYGGKAIKLSYASAPSFKIRPKNIPLTRAADMGSSLNTTGTVFVLSLPSGMKGAGTFQVFTAKGVLTRSLVLGDLAGGFDHYIEWDGKDDAGQPVSPGAYYGIFSLPGVAQNAMIKFTVTR